MLYLVASLRAPFTERSLGRPTRLRIAVTVIKECSCYEGQPVFLYWDADALPHNQGCSSDTVAFCHMAPAVSQDKEVRLEPWLCCM